MRSFLHNNAILIGLLFIAALLRIWQLGSVPPSPSLDEVSIGYNAFSLLKTGRDEYGYFLPIILRAYDDWRPALYIYLVVPFIAVFGLNVFAVRLLSVVLSLLTIYLAYRLVKILFPESILVRGFVIHTELLAYSVVFLLALSPWHIYLSRLGHEVNLGLFLTVASVYAFLRSVIAREKWSFTIAAILFGLSFYSYQSQKVIIPILLITVLILYKKEVVRFGKTSLVAGSVFFFIALPAVILTFSPEGMMRFRGTSVFSTAGPSYQSANDLLKAKNDHNLLGELYFNRRFVPVRLVTSQYVSHFNPRWLFAGSERENHKVPFLGLFYIFEAPLLLLGILLFVFSNIERRLKVLLLIWFFTGPLPGAITTDAPHAMRSFTLLPPAQIFEGLGLVSAYSLLKIKRLHLAGLALFFVFVMYSVGFFLSGYFYVFPKTQADSFQLSLFNSLGYLVQNKDRYEEAVVSSRNNLYQSYMFYLFVSQYDPESYQSQGGTISGGFAKEHKIGSISFRPIQWNTEKKQGKIVYLGNKEDFDEAAAVIRRFTYPDGKEGVVIVAYD